MMNHGTLENFRLPEACYTPAVRAIMKETQQRFGLDEWRVVVLTNEIHGHLGIYSTLGAKMGCMAREYAATAEEPHVLSFAGVVPPVSCFNDGLQISTGATVGHGLISVADEEEKRPEAVFRFGKKSFRMCLREEYARQIACDIRSGVEQFGHMPAYWAYVRELAIRYWSEWDRHEIFSIEPLD